MEIPLLVLVLQIGFNAALNNRGYNSNPVIPSPRFLNSRQTRRLADPDSYLQLSSRGLPDSDEQSDSGESGSFEDYSYRSIRPPLIRPNQRANNYMRSTPDDRIGSSTQQERLQKSSYLTRRADSYLTQPYSRNGVANLRPDQNIQNYRKVNDDSSFEVSSQESTNSEDSSRLGEEATYLRSLLSLMEHPNNRRGQNRKYYSPGNGLSSDVSPIDKLGSDEDNIPNSLNKRRNSNPDDYADSILLVADDDDKLDEEINNNLPPIRGLKQGPRVQNYDQLTRKYNRMNNNNAGLETTLNDNAGRLTVLRLANLEDLNPDSPLLRYGNPRKNNNRNYLRLSLSPDNKITLDEGVASELSEILSETLDELNLTPVNLRRSNLPNKYSRRNNNRLNSEQNDLRLSSLDANLSSKSILRAHGNHTRQDHKKLLDEDSVKTLDPSLRTHGNHTAQVIKKLPQPRRYREPANHNSKKILRTQGNHEDTVKTLDPSIRTHGNHTREVPKTEVGKDTVKALKPSLRIHGNHTRQVLKKLHEEDTAKALEPILRTYGNHTRHELQKLFDEHTAKSLVPYHEGKSNNTKHKRPNNSKEDDGWPDEYSLDTLFDFRKEGNMTDDITNLDNSSSEPSLLKSSDENVQKDDAVLHLEFPWNGALSPYGNKSKSELNTNEKDSTKNTTDTLELEFPWNGALSPDTDKGEKQISREDDMKDSLHLDYPWNGQLSPDKNKTVTILRTEIDRQDKMPKDDLKLEFPSGVQESHDKSSSQKSLRIPDPFYIHPYLRNRNINKHPNYFRRAYDEYSKGLRLIPENLKNRRYDSYRRRPQRRRYDDLEVIGLSRSSEEDPSDVITFPSDRKPSSV